MLKNVRTHMQLCLSKQSICNVFRVTLGTNLNLNTFYFSRGLCSFHIYFDPDNLPSPYQ
jgi:hypothetical protein